MSCRCQACGREYKVDIIVDDPLWEKIRPDKSRNPDSGLLCPVCIVKKIIDLTDGYSVFKLKSEREDDKNIHNC